jgi:lysozyme
MNKFLLLILLSFTPVLQVLTPAGLSETTRHDFSPQTVSARGINLIKRYEGLRLKSYKCPAGYKTIGYGHQTRTLSRITLEQAEALLADDLEPVEQHINAMGIELTQNQFDAVCSFAFNVGIYKFSKSTFASTLDPEELKKWVYANNRKLPGLIKRRNEEYNLYNNSGGSFTGRRLDRTKDCGDYFYESGSAA